MINVADIYSVSLFGAGLLKHSFISIKFVKESINSHKKSLYELDNLMILEEDQTFHGSNLE
jgi:hypothetical protein